jgi:hypothetical protein
MKRENLVSEVGFGITGWDSTALRTEQLDDPNIGPILQELETGQRPE